MKVEVKILGIAARYLVLAVPMAWCTIESMLSPIRMPKLLFLCPMDKAMRKGYIQGSFLFRVVIHSALGVLGAVLSMALGNDWLGAMGVSLNIFLYSLLCVVFVLWFKSLAFNVAILYFSLSSLSLLEMVALIVTAQIDRIIPITMIIPNIL